MRRLWLRFYLWLNGYATCEHPNASVRYCATCVAKERAIALRKYEAEEAKIQAMQAELRGE